MRIRTWIDTIAAVLIALAITTAVGVGWFTREAARHKANAAFAGEMRGIHFARMGLRNQYLLQGTARAMNQWRQKTEDLARLLDQAPARFGDAVERGALDAIRKDFEDTRSIMERLFSREVEAPSGRRAGHFADEGARRLIGQVFERADSLNSRLTLLKNSLDGVTAREYRHQLTALGVLAAAMLALVVGNALALRSVLAKRLALLRAGAARFGSGELAHRIEVRGDDELSELAGAMNEMAAKLLASYASREELLREVEKRRLAEGTVLKSGEHFRSLMENLGSGIVVHAEDTSILYSNTEAARALGLTSEQMRGKEVVDPAWRFVHEDGTTMPLEHYPVNLVIASGAPLRDYIVGIDRPGEAGRAWVIVNAFPEEGEGGRLRQVVVTFNDITALKRAEAVLAASERQYHTLFREMLDGFALHEIVCDGEGKPVDYRFLEVNPAFEHLTGLLAADVVGRTVSEILPGMEPEWIERYGSVALTGVSCRFESYSAPLGKHFEVKSFSPRPGQFAAVFVDITQRKRAEEAVMKAIAEITRSNAELEQFAYIASHDLQEPLRSIAGFLQLIKRRYREQLDGEGIEFIDFAVAGATRLQSMIEGLLVYSRIGKQAAAQAPVDLGRALAQALENLTAALVEAGAVVTGDPLPTVTGDEDQIVQLFQNLVGNAVKHRGTAPPQVHVSCRQDPEGPVVMVRDNGIGIAPEHQKRVFEIFRRLQGPAVPGAGIGLALCRRIVERAGGRIWVESEPGRGATFSFTLSGKKGEP